MFRPIAAIFSFDNFLANRVLYNIILDILDILYKTLLARKLSNLNMTAIGRNM